MARSFNESEYLYADTAPVSSWPLTIACWCTRWNNPSTTRCIMSLGGSSTSDHVMISWRNDAGYPFAMGFADNGSAGYGNSTISTSPNTWYHACAVYASNTSRTIYANAGNTATNTTNYTGINGFDKVGIGARRFGASTNADPLGGRVAHAAVWSVGLSAAEVASLYNNGIGADPRSVRPDALVAYWPLLNNDGDQDYWGNFHLTASGSPTYVKHPPVLMRSRPKYVILGSAAPTVGEVTITGTRTIGETITANATPTPGDATLTYQWEKSATGVGAGTDISGETASTLALTYADFGDILDTAAYVRCGVVATKDAVPSVETFSSWLEVSAGGAASVGSPFVSSSIR